MNSQVSYAENHEHEEDCETVRSVSRKRKVMSGREFRKLLASKRRNARDDGHRKQDGLSESGCSTSGTNEPCISNMRVAESSCPESKEKGLDDSLQEQTSTCNVEVICTSGTNEPCISNMKVAESACPESKENGLDGSLQEQTSTCNVEVICTSGTHEPCISNMRVAESECPESKEKGLDNCLQEQTSTCNVEGSKTLLSELLTLPFEFKAQVDNNHLSYVNKLLIHWRTNENAVVFDNQEGILKMVLLISAFASDMKQPFLIITSPASVSHWEDEFLHCAPSINIVAYKGSGDVRASLRAMEFYNEHGAIKFQVLISHCNAVVEAIYMLRSICWEAIIIDAGPQSSVLNNIEDMKMLTSDKKLLLFRKEEDRRFSYEKFLTLLNPEHKDANSDFQEGGNDTSDIMLKEKFSKFIVYKCKKSSMYNFVEYWVPVGLSDVQIEQYCDCLLSNAHFLCSSLKSSLQKLLTSTRKCCNHPYLVDRTLRQSIVEGIQGDNQLDAEIKLSGKLQLLTRILFEIRQQGLRVLILFQGPKNFKTPYAFLPSDHISTGDILDDVIHQKFGKDSYARISLDVDPKIRQERLEEFNLKKNGQFVLLMERSASAVCPLLSAIDTVILFDSDWDPMNDVRALQKITFDSKLEQLKVFRLYSPCTIEEKILILAKSGLTIKRMDYTTSHELLTWGASYLFSKHDDCHCSSDNIASKALPDDVFSELLKLLPGSSENRGSDNCSMILKVQQNAGAYTQSISLPGELEMQLIENSSFTRGLTDHNGETSLFWRNLLEGRRPSRKPLASPSHTVREQNELLDDSHKYPVRERSGKQKARKKRKAKKTKVTGVSPIPASVKCGSQNHFISDHCSDKQVATSGEHTQDAHQMESVTLNYAEMSSHVDWDSLIVESDPCHGSALATGQLVDSTNSITTEYHNDITVAPTADDINMINCVDELRQFQAPNSVLEVEPSQPLDSLVHHPAQSSQLNVSAVQADRMERNCSIPRSTIQQCFGDINSIESSGIIDVPQSHFFDPLQIEMNKIQKEREKTMKLLEDLKLLLRCEREKEMDEIKKKYDLLFQNVEVKIVQMQKEFDARHTSVYSSKLLAQFMTEKTNVDYTFHLQEMQEDGESLASQPVNPPTQVYLDQARNHQSAAPHTANLQMPSASLVNSGTMFFDPILQPVLQSLVVSQTPVRPLSSVSLGSCGQYPRLSVVSEPSACPQVTSESLPVVGANSRNPELATTPVTFTPLQPQLLSINEATNAPCTTSMWPERSVIRAPAPHLRRFRV